MLRRISLFSIISSAFSSIRLLVAYRR
jgi:hypothetical protein